MTNKQYRPRFPTGVKNARRAGYRNQVLMRLIAAGCGERLSAAEETKIKRVAAFLPARTCADEIIATRYQAPGSHRSRTRTDRG